MLISYYVFQQRVAGNEETEEAAIVTENDEKDASGQYRKFEEPLQSKKLDLLEKHLQHI